MRTPLLCALALSLGLVAAGCGGGGGSNSGVSSSSSGGSSSGGTVSGPRINNPTVTSTVGTTTATSINVSFLGGPLSFTVDVPDADVASVSARVQQTGGASTDVPMTLVDGSTTKYHGTFTLPYNDSATQAAEYKVYVSAADSAGHVTTAQIGKPVVVAPSDTAPPLPWTVLTPTFSPGAGTYAHSVAVSISCATSGATIRYTVDGSDPSLDASSSSLTYTGKITLTGTATLKAKGFLTGWTPSSTATAVYTVNP